MAQITGVQAAGWHDLLQHWWQFVNNQLYTANYNLVADI